MGRPKGSKNKKTSTLTDELLDELREQEEDFVSKDNQKVLDVITDSDYDDELDSSMTSYCSDDSQLPSLASSPAKPVKATTAKAISSTQPAPPCKESKPKISLHTLMDPRGSKKTRISRNHFKLIGGSSR